MSQPFAKTARCPTGDPDCGCADFQAEACLHDQPVANPASGRNFDLAFVMRDCGGDIEKAQRRIDLALDARDEEVKRLRDLLREGVGCLVNITKFDDIDSFVERAADALKATR